VPSERLLAGGASTGGVVRIGDTVRRPAGPNVELMREVLLHLERAGFDAAPRWLGLDAEGRVVLSWIDGDTYVDRSQMHPYIGEPPVRVTFSDGQIAAVMRLLRRYHDAFGADVVCHGDFGPWNLVWRAGIPVAVIDFDGVYRGPTADDVAYALRMFVGYGFADARPEELVARTRIAVAAYGAELDVAAILEHEYDRAEARCRQNAWLRQLERLPTERAWLAAHRTLF
jgi:Phosphotransferase enzyme family